MWLWRSDNKSEWDIVGWEVDARVLWVWLLEKFKNSRRVTNPVLLASLLPPANWSTSTDASLTVLGISAANMPLNRHTNFPQWYSVSTPCWDLVNAHVLASNFPLTSPEFRASRVRKWMLASSSRRSAFRGIAIISFIQHDLVRFSILALRL
jgi:hypothetical protein